MIGLTYTSSTCTEKLNRPIFLFLLVLRFLQFTFLPQHFSGLIATISKLLLLTYQSSLLQHEMPLCNGRSSVISSPVHRSPTLYQSTEKNALITSPTWFARSTNIFQQWIINIFFLLLQIFQTPLQVMFSRQGQTAVNAMLSSFQALSAEEQTNCSTQCQDQALPNHMEYPCIKGQCLMQSK